MKIDAKYLPSRKFLVGLGIIAVLTLIAVIFSFFGNRPYQSEDNNNLVAATSSSFEAFKLVDTDKDSLPDWQEALYGTDPKKADTDGDGTPDGAEINANRDPLKANTAGKGQEPNDKISADTIAKNEKTLQEYKDLTFTDRMARDIVSQYIASKQVGSKLSATDKELIMLNSLPQIQVKKYTTDDITMYSATNTKEEIRKYINEVAYIILQTSSIADKYKIKNEYVTLEKVMSTGDENLLNDLDPIINILVIELKSLLALPIYENLIDTHLNLINTLGDKIAGLYGMKKIFSDPIQAMILLKSYQSGDDGMYAVISGIINMANEQRITFSTNEYGYYLVNMIKLQ